MEQYWYIVKNQNHFGPYYLEDIKQLKLQNKLDNDAVLWHPKWPAPTLDFTHTKSLPPTPEKTKTYRKLNSISSLSRVEQHQKSYENMITTLPQPISSISSYFSKFTFQNPFKFKIDQRASMLIILIFCGSLIFNLNQNTSIPSRPESLAPSQFKQFQDFWELQTVSSEQIENQFYAMMSKDYKTLWLGSHQNLLLESINLSAEAKNILAKTDYNKIWEQQSNEKLMGLNFENNELPPMGFYQLTVNWIESAPWSFDVTKKTTTIAIKIGTHNDEQLLGLVKRFHEQSVDGNLVVVDSSQTELKEKYQTLSSLITDIKRNWVEIKELKHPNMAKAMNEFQISYARSTGSFLSALVLNNEKEIKDLSQGKRSVNTSLIAHLHNLTEKAKKTGLLSAELMSNYRSYAKNPKKDALWTQKVADLEKDLLDKMNQL